MLNIRVRGAWTLKWEVLVWKIIIFLDKMDYNKWVSLLCQISICTHIVPFPNVLGL